MDYTGFLSAEAARGGPQRIRELISLIQDGPKDLLNLTAGLPNDESFLLKQMTITLRDGTEIKLAHEDMRQAQQYWSTSGLNNFSDLLRRLVHQLHKPPCWDKSPEEGKTTVYPTCGGTDCINQVFSLLMNPGDHIIMEEFSYSGPNVMVQAKKLVPELVSSDEAGMIPDSLRQVLSRWNPDAKPGETDKPKLMYIIPNGQNPTGATYTLERKRQIYKIAQEYNIIIFEDDPYFTIVYDELIPSFLSLDTDGRVLRGDSFSKSLAPGFRSGYLSGPDPLMSKVLERLGVTSFGTGAMSQTIIMAILAKLGIDGFLDHARRTAQLYKSQRDLMMTYVEKWLSGLVDYQVPQSGMFLWLKIKGITDTNDLMMKKALPAGVLTVPGDIFSPIKARENPYVRVSFSNQSAQIFDQAFERLSKVIRENMKHSE